MSDLLDAALSYARLGWGVIPLHWPVGADRCSCGGGGPKHGTGKHPRIGSWGPDCDEGEGASWDEDVIREWWRETPHANVGVETGWGSDIFVLDVDGEKGAASLAALERDFGALLPTVEARTGSGGRHLVFAHPGRDFEVTTRAGIAPGIDIRGDRGLIAASPSRHKSGSRYEWTRPPGSIPVALSPAWLLVLVQGKRREEPAWELPPLLVAESTARGKGALRKVAGDIAAAQPGYRNRAINNGPFWIGQLVARGEIALDDARQVLVTAEAEWQLGAHERERNRRKIEGALRAGMRKA